MLFRELELAGAPYDGLSICTMLASVIAHVGQRHAAARGAAQAAGGRVAHRARVLRARLRAPTSPPPARARCATATVGASTARRSSPAWPRSPSGSSSSPAPIPTCPSTRASRSSSCRRRHPGFELQPIRTLSGKRTNTTFYDGVYVDDEWRVGEVERWLAGDAGRAVVRAGRRRWGARRRAAAHRRRGARARPRSTTTAVRCSHDPDRRDALVRLAIDCEVTDLLAEPGGVGGGLGPAPRGRGRGDASCSRPRRSSARPTACSTRPGPSGLVQSHDVDRPRARSTSTATASRPSPRSTAAPARSSATSSPNAGSACRARADAADACAGSRTSASRRTWTRSAPRYANSSPARSRRDGDTHRDPTDLTGWDEPFERDVLRRAGAAGLLGVSLPAELGGGGRPPSWQAVVSFEAAYHDAPLIDTAAVIVAPTRRRVRVRAAAGRGRAGRVRGHGERLHRVHRGGGRERPVEHRDARRTRWPAGSCSTARRCSSPARTSPTGAAPSPAPIRRRPAATASPMFLRRSCDTRRRGRRATPPPTAGPCRTMRFDRAAVGR